MMKEGFDKEIDSLLRRRARAVAESFADGDDALRGAAAAAHLDADELSAFAEGALPSAARVAAASHMADCDECRGAVVALSRTGGGAELKERAAAVPASNVRGGRASWRAWAAALFSPRALRFAAPALALSVVAVVSFVALRAPRREPAQLARSERGRAEVSKNQSDAVPSASTAMGNVNTGVGAEQTYDDGPGNSNAAAAAAQPHLGRGHGGVLEDAPAPSVVATGPVPAAPAPPPAAGGETPAESAKTATRTAEADASDAETAEVKNREKSARQAEPAEEVAANDPAAQQQRRGTQSRANDPQSRAGEMPDGGSRNRGRSADSNASNVYGGSGAGIAAAPPKESERDSAGARAPAAARRSRPANRAEMRGDDEVSRVGETRAAAGHRFRREGSAWVDVNYKPSMPSTGVRRGSEAFRALVADLPEVGRVAEQIGGEVVVVVRGRAYRIR